MTSKAMRDNELFMRTSFPGSGRWGIPCIKKQIIDICNPSFIAYSATKTKDIDKNLQKGVHFFLDDYRFNSIYKNPQKSLAKLSQYAYLITPDYSTYSQMKPWRQIESIAHSRWCGAYWQSKGLTVIPAITWSTPASFTYCFDGIEKGAIVAISTIGCVKYKFAFLRGYNAMLARLEPSAILCYGEPFKEMQGNVIHIEYNHPRKAGD